MKITLERILSVINECNNINRICIKLDIIGNTNNRNKILKIIHENNLDISHFNKKSNKPRKYPRVIKKCENCNNVFETGSGIKKEKGFVPNHVRI